MPRNIKTVICVEPLETGSHMLVRAEIFFTYEKDGKVQRALGPFATDPERVHSLDAMTSSVQAWVRRFVELRAKYSKNEQAIAKFMEEWNFRGMPDMTSVPLEDKDSCHQNR